jgi:hypothetical protein
VRGRPIDVNQRVADLQLVAHTLVAGGITMGLIVLVVRLTAQWSTQIALVSALGVLTVAVVVFDVLVDRQLRRFRSGRIRSGPCPLRGVDGAGRH